MTGSNGVLSRQIHGTAGRHVAPTPSVRTNA
jgi:hypothetical protein